MIPSCDALSPRLLLSLLMTKTITESITLEQFPLFVSPLASRAASKAGDVARATAAANQDLARPPTAAREYAIALLCVIVVATIRILLHPVLASASPLLIFVLPTVIMVMRNAPLPAVCAAIASTAIAVRLFIAPTDAIWWAHPAQQTRLALFLAENATIVAVGCMLQRYRQRELDNALKAERLRVVHVTMRTVQDVVNNSLNQLQGLRLEAEGHVPAESLAAFDATIQGTFEKLTALGNLRTYAEKRMEIGDGLDDSPA
jgi:K+-sensing histidine kinase KdpD